MVRKHCQKIAEKYRVSEAYRTHNGDGVVTLIKEDSFDDFASTMGMTNDAVA